MNKYLNKEPPNSTTVKGGCSDMTGEFKILEKDLYCKKQLFGNSSTPQDKEKESDKKEPKMKHKLSIRAVKNSKSLKQNSKHSNKINKKKSAINKENSSQILKKFRKTQFKDTFQIGKSQNYIFREGNKNIKKSSKTQSSQIILKKKNSIKIPFNYQTSICKESRIFKYTKKNSITKQILQQQKIKYSTSHQNIQPNRPKHKFKPSSIRSSQHTNVMGAVIQFESQKQKNLGIKIRKKVFSSQKKMSLNNKEGKEISCLDKPKLTDNVSHLQNLFLTKHSSSLKSFANGLSHLHLNYILNKKKKKPNERKKKYDINSLYNKPTLNKHADDLFKKNSDQEEKSKILKKKRKSHYRVTEHNISEMNQI